MRLSFMVMLFGLGLFDVQAIRPVRGYNKIYKGLRESKNDAKHLSTKSRDNFFSEEEQHPFIEREYIFYLISGNVNVSAGSIERDYLVQKYISSKQIKLAVALSATMTSSLIARILLTVVQYLLFTSLMLSSFYHQSHCRM